MKIFFLGTAAFEGFPNPFCNGTFCEHSRREKINRLRSSAVIDDKILIDFGPDIVASSQKFTKKLFEIEILLITHSHPDHLYLPNLGLRMAPYNESYEELCKMHIISNETVISEIAKHKYFDKQKNSLKVLAPFFKYNLKKYEIMAVPANHKTSSDEQPFLYCIHNTDKTIFYATDTGPLNEKTLKTLKEKLPYKIDMLVMDATLGLSDSVFPYHHSFKTLKNEIERFKKYNLLSENPKIYAHHFSHHNNEFNDIKEKYNGIGVEVSLDGMEVKI
ncbi:MAG: phosphoribosyl 1,2-cyclic phosphate phosphodiesterase [Kosmotogales bacterium]|nr:phosphoribosyl 1,2-cyclic phosphate phosphodiesterase [Kosmotogales bacterium]